MNKLCATPPFVLQIAVGTFAIRLKADPPTSPTRIVAMRCRNIQLINIFKKRGSPPAHITKPYPYIKVHQFTSFSSPLNDLSTLHPMSNHPIAHWEDAPSNYRLVITRRSRQRHRVVEVYAISITLHKSNFRHVSATDIPNDRSPPTSIKTSSIGVSAARNDVRIYRRRPIKSRPKKSSLEPALLMTFCKRAQFIMPSPFCSL